MVGINQPSNQIKLTNVSIVRLRKGGKRFEAACYRNKVLEWRSGVESDIDEVLQIHSVFINVGKGQVASQEDLRKCFGSDDIEKILLEILKKGELQVGEKERSHQMENLQKDIILTISSKCVDPRTKRPYTVGIIEKAIGEIGFSINIGKSAKSQALEAIKQLQEKAILPITRARMRVRIICDMKEGKRLHERLVALAADIESEDWSNSYEMIASIDPGNYRAIGDLLREESHGRGQVEVLDLRDAVDGDEVF